MRSCAGQLAEPKEKVAHQELRIAQKTAILQLLRQFQALLPRRKAGSQLTADHLKCSEAPKRPYVFRQVSPETLAQLNRPCRDLPGVRRGKPFASPKRRQQRDLKRKLLLLALRTIGKHLEDFEAAVQMRDGFEIG